MKRTYHNHNIEDYIDYHNIRYILVKAPFFRLVLYLPLNPTPHAVFYHTARVYGAFTDLLVLRGRIIGVIQCDSL